MPRVRVAVHLRRLIGNREQRQRHTAGRLPAGLDRGQLRRLMFERVETVLVADQDLQRNENRQEP